jgi:MinD superfamily P-loop ATPase
MSPSHGRLVGEPKQLVVLSGKGGTGKTSVTAALAHLASQEVMLCMADADVDAANLELLLNVDPVTTHEFSGGVVARIDADRCTGCGACRAACRFGAISWSATDHAYIIEGIACEGCAACLYRCPVGAIATLPDTSGLWYLSETDYGPLYHAHLYAGGENSGKLVTLVKQQARLRALEDQRAVILIDGPPGVGCPAISALSGADLALMVVEPTLSSVHDLARVVDLAVHFGVPARVLINKVDLSEARAREVEVFCAGRGIAVVGRIPYDTVMVEAMVQGVPVTTFTQGKVVASLRDIWCIIRGELLK